MFKFVTIVSIIKSCEHVRTVNPQKLKPAKVNEYQLPVSGEPVAFFLSRSSAMSRIVSRTSTAVSRPTSSIMSARMLRLISSQPTKLYSRASINRMITPVGVCTLPKSSMSPVFNLNTDQDNYIYVI